MDSLAQFDGYEGHHLYSNCSSAALVTQEKVGLASIYEDDYSLCVWTPPVCNVPEQYSKALAVEGFQFKQVVRVDNILSSLDSLPSDQGQLAMKHWIADLIEIYATLFGLDQVGVRIAGRQSPMCPKFHVDHVPTRLVHSLFGTGCDWLDDPLYFNTDEINSKSLDGWLKEAESFDNQMISQVPDGAVVVMKGTQWSEHCRPVIHRSPKHDQARLVLTLDFA